MKLNACIKHWKTPIVIVSFICVVAILVVVWHCYSQELAKFLGYLFGGGLLFWQISVTSRRAAAAEKTAELTEIGNIAERFKNAIEHLGNDSASVHLGGIYALHHIAQEVEGYRKRVFEILCAHIRETTTQMEYKTRETSSKEIEPTIEIQSILNLLFIDTQDREIYKGLQGNLEDADLQGAVLIKADLQYANLYRANLQNADLRVANLQRTDLLGANLQNADLWAAKLQNVDLTNVQNLEVKQLLKAETLYGAGLPEGMKEEIMQKEPGLFKDLDA